MSVNLCIFLWLFAHEKHCDFREKNLTASPVMNFTFKQPVARYVFWKARSGMTPSKERQEPVGGWDIQLPCSPSKYHTMHTILFQAFSSYWGTASRNRKDRLGTRSFHTPHFPLFCLAFLNSFQTSACKLNQINPFDSQRTPQRKPASALTRKRNSRRLHAG